MNIAIDCKITVLDDTKSKVNSFSLESLMTGSNTPDESSSEYIVNNYEVDQTLKYVFSLDSVSGPAFDKKLKEDILNNIDVTKITGVQISCYNTTPTDQDSNSLPFEIWDSVSSTKMLKTSFFAIFDIYDYALNLEIKGLATIPTNKTVNLVFIVTLKK